MAIKHCKQGGFGAIGQKAIFDEGCCVMDELLSSISGRQDVLGSQKMEYYLTPTPLVITYFVFICIYINIDCKWGLFITLTKYLYYSYFINQLQSSFQMESYQSKFQRAIQLSQQHQLHNSLELFKNLYAQHPEHTTVLLNYGTLLFKARYFAQAKLIYSQLLAIDKFNFMAYYNRGIIHFSERKYLQSFQDLNLSLTLLCLQKGKKLKNIQLLDKAIVVNYDNVMAFIQKAKCYEKQNNIQKAQQNFSTAIYLRENHYYPYLERAQFFWRRNKVEEAQKDFSKYRSLKQQQKALAESLMPQNLQLQNLNYQQILVKVKQILSEYKVIYFKEKDRYQEQERLESKKSLEILEQSSKNISKEIEELENEIRGQRGEIYDENGSFDGETFLSVEIQKVAEDIEKHKKTVQETIQQSQTSSFSSKFTEAKAIDDQLFKTYTKFKIQIASAQIFDHEDIKGYGDGRIKLEYCQQKKQTDYSSENMWNKKLSFEIDHSKPLIQVELEMKGKGFWSSNKVIGKGEINLMECGQTKCIISNEELKTGVVYYKLKLLKA